MPTSEQRAVVVRKDLDNVIHPIVPHKQIEQQQLVIVSAKDSTVVDADGREYLDGKRLVERCQERGVIVGRSGGGAHLGNTLVLAPPLVLTRAEIDRIVSVLDQTIPEICPEAVA
ncbi:MAG: hypothetical protein ACREI6_01170 [Candidatus Rokuibacteriota bacterium]